jgi:hypothetical protein
VAASCALNERHTCACNACDCALQVVMKNPEPAAQAPGTPVAAATQGLTQRMAATSLGEGGTAAATK